MRRVRKSNKIFKDEFSNFHRMFALTSSYLFHFGAHRRKAFFAQSEDDNFAIFLEFSRSSQHDAES